MSRATFFESGLLDLERLSSIGLEVDGLGQRWVMHVVRAFVRKEFSLLLIFLLSLVFRVLPKAAAIIDSLLDLVPCGCLREHARFVGLDESVEWSLWSSTFTTLTYINLENVLLNPYGHIRLADFDTTRCLSQSYNVPWYCTYIDTRDGYLRAL